MKLTAMALCAAMSPGFAAAADWPGAAPGSEMQRTAPIQVPQPGFQPYGYGYYVVPVLPGVIDGNGRYRRGPDADRPRPPAPRDGFHGNDGMHDDR